MLFWHPCICNNNSVDNSLAGQTTYKALAYLIFINVIKQWLWITLGTKYITWLYTWLGKDHDFGKKQDRAETDWWINRKVLTSDAGFNPT